MGQASLSGDREGHARACYPPRTRGDGRTSAQGSRSAPGTAALPGPPGSMAEPRGLGSGLLHPPEPDTSAFGPAPRPVHGCRPDLRVVTLTAGRIWPDSAPPGEVLPACSGSPSPYPAASGGGLACKAQVLRGTPSRAEGAGAVCCCGKGVSGFAGTRGGLGARGRPLLRCSDPHGERPLGRVGPQIRTWPRVAEAARET